MTNKAHTQTKHYTQPNTNYVNNTRTLLQTTGGRDESKIVFMIRQDSIIYFVITFDLAKS